MKQADGKFLKFGTLYLLKIHHPCLTFGKGQHLPPKSATILMTWLLPKDDSLTTLANLVVEYQEIAKALGYKVARHWYWKQALTSVLPYAKSWLWWFVKKAGALAGLGEMIRRFIG